MNRQCSAVSNGAHRNYAFRGLAAEKIITLTESKNHSSQPDEILLNEKSGAQDSYLPRPAISSRVTVAFSETDPDPFAYVKPAAIFRATLARLVGASSTQGRPDLTPVASKSQFSFSGRWAIEREIGPSKKLESIRRWTLH